jgi:dynein heavy chain, axonemal
MKKIDDKILEILA